APGDAPRRAGGVPAERGLYPDVERPGGRRRRGGLRLDRAAEGERGERDWRLSEIHGSPFLYWDCCTNARSASAEYLLPVGSCTRTGARSSTLRLESKLDQL